MNYQEKQLDLEIEFELLLQQKPAIEDSFYKNTYWTYQANPLIQYAVKDLPPYCNIWNVLITVKLILVEFQKYTTARIKCYNFPGLTIMLQEA